MTEMIYGTVGTLLGITVILLLIECSLLLFLYMLNTVAKLREVLLEDDQKAQSRNQKGAK